LGRWTQVDLCGGFVLLESEDTTALAEFARGWSDLLELTITPVLEDRELSDVLERAGARPGRAETGLSVPPETYPEDTPVVPETTPGTPKPPYEEIA
jgi:Protein of unknown function (DUF3303)